MKREKITKLFSHMPSIHTERLILRPMRVSDAQDMYRYARREDVTTYLLWAPYPSLDFAKQYLKYIEDRYAVGDFFDWGVIDRESGRMIGTCGFTTIDAPNNVGQIGYVLNPNFTAGVLVQRPRGRFCTLDLRSWGSIGSRRNLCRATMRHATSWKSSA